MCHLPFLCIFFPHMTMKFLVVKDLILVVDGFCFPRVQFELWDSDDVPVPRQELLKKVKGVDGLLCVLTEKIDAELLDAAGVRTVIEPVK